MFDEVFWELLCGTRWVQVQWRTRFRQAMNRAENQGNARAVDSLLNYETVKFFGNEVHETARYDECLRGAPSSPVPQKLRQQAPQH